MKKLANKIALITGASAGIGAATARLLAAEGADVIITARRVEKLEQLAKEIKQEYKIRVLPLALDVQNKTQVQDTLAALPSEWQAVDILVNNAGLGLTLDSMQVGNPDNWDIMIDTNIKGLLYVTRAVLPGMLERDRGHIVNIGSVAAYEKYPGGNVYAATKAAVRSLNKSLRIDLLGTPIRVTEIAPGMVETEFSEVRYSGDKERAAKTYQGLQPLVAEDIADAVVYSVTRPAHVNIETMKVFPTAQASVSHVARKK